MSFSGMPKGLGIQECGPHLFGTLPQFIVIVSRFVAMSSHEGCPNSATSSFKVSTQSILVVG